MGHHHHGGSSGGGVALDTPRFVLVGSPNAGKSSVFNALTGLHAKIANYPGVTVSRYFGNLTVEGTDLVIEDLPGSYSLEPISPDEQITADVLAGTALGQRPDGVLAVVDATTLHRSLYLLAEVLALGLPTCVVLTFTDELMRRGGRVDASRLEQALGVPVVSVVAQRGIGMEALRESLGQWRTWPTAPISPPTDPAEFDAWAGSILKHAEYQPPTPDGLTQRVDSVLLHPLWGTLIFFAVMLAFFETIFTLAAPLQDYVEAGFAWLGEQVAAHVPIDWLATFIGQALIGGVGSVLVFVPQIVLLFLLLALLEGVGYMARAAFLMDRVMAKAGLEGRAFVALLSSVACAIPGIMATRTLPSARDRIATMMAAPLMTCSARLPVYVLLIGMFVDPKSSIGPFGAQGLIMFGLYLLGAVSAMFAAWAFKRVGDRGQPVLPFSMELPPYRVPSLRSVLLTVWDSARAFLHKCSTVIVATSIVLWILLNVPIASDADLAAAGVDRNDAVAVSSYTVDHSLAADVGRALEPVFAPMGFDWRINVGLLSAQAARETFVATMGQVAAAEDPEDPAGALRAMTHQSGPLVGQPLFSPPTIAALLVWFVYAMQCMATMGVLRRETGTWKWPLIAFGYLTSVAYVMALLAHTITAAVTR